MRSDAPDSLAVGAPGESGTLRAGCVGLVVHSGAAQDVRRLTSLARTVDAHERVNVVARVLAGLEAHDPGEVRYMREPTRIVERAAAVLAASLGRPVRLPLVPATADESRDAEGTAACARALAEAGAACVITLGGDGTNRAVVAGWPEVVLVPLAGGTNNAVALAIDPTAAGRSAALAVADAELLARHVHRSPRLQVSLNGGPSTTALVDVALVTDEWIGAHAIWDPARLVEAVVTRGDPAVSGLAGVAGTVRPMPPGPSEALHMRFGAPGREILAPLGPGQVVPLRVRDWRVVGPGEAVTLCGAGTIAVDGERRLELPQGRRAVVALTPDGPGVLDAAAVLREAACAPGRDPAGTTTPSKPDSPSTGGL